MECNYAETNELAIYIQLSTCWFNERAVRHSNISSYVKRVWHEFCVIVLIPAFTSLHLSSFQRSIERNTKFHWYSFHSLCDWPRKLAPLTQPDTKVKNPRSIKIRSPAFPSTFGSLVVLILTWFLIGYLRYFPFFWLAVVITLVFVLRYSIEKRNKF